MASNKKAWEQPAHNSKATQSMGLCAVSWLLCHAISPRSENCFESFDVSKHPSAPRSSRRSWWNAPPYVAAVVWLRYRIGVHQANDGVWVLDLSACYSTSKILQTTEVCVDDLHMAQLTSLPIKRKLYHQWQIIVRNNMWQPKHPLPRKHPFGSGVSEQGTAPSTSLTAWSTAVVNHLLQGFCHTTGSTNRHDGLLCSNTSRPGSPSIDCVTRCKFYRDECSKGGSAIFPRHSLFCTQRLVRTSTLQSQSIGRTWPALALPWKSGIEEAPSPSSAL